VGVTSVNHRAERAKASELEEDRDE